MLIVYVIKKFDSAMALRIFIASCVTLHSYVKHDQKKCHDNLDDCYWLRLCVNITI